MASARPKVLKMKPGEDYSPLLQPCKEVELKDIATPAIKGLISNLKATLDDEIYTKAKTSPQTHPTPAYLAANQIGSGHRVVLLNLPGSGSSVAKEVVMLNPSYTVDESSLKEAKSAAKPEYRISTLFADQFRFRNDCYADRVCVSYTDTSAIRQVLYLQGMNAIAAQMGIDFVHGKTPLDRISPAELLEFANEPGASKIISTRKAYIHHGREVNDKDPQFAEKPEQAGLFKEYIQLRHKFPCPVEVKQEPQRTKRYLFNAAF